MSRPESVQRLRCLANGDGIRTAVGDADEIDINFAAEHDHPRPAGGCSPGRHSCSDRSRPGSITGAARPSCRRNRCSSTVADSSCCPPFGFRGEPAEFEGQRKIGGSITEVLWFRLETRPALVLSYCTSRACSMCGRITIPQLTILRALGRRRIPEGRDAHTTALTTFEGMTP